MEWDSQFTYTSLGELKTTEASKTCKVPFHEEHGASGNSEPTISSTSNPSTSTVRRLFLCRDVHYLHWFASKGRQLFYTPARSPMWVYLAEQNRITMVVISTHLVSKIMTLCLLTIIRMVPLKNIKSRLTNHVIKYIHGCLYNLATMISFPKKWHSIPAKIYLVWYTSSLLIAQLTE
jgi:hypothetical protein